MAGLTEKVSQRAPMLIAHTKALAGHGFGSTRTTRWTWRFRCQAASHTKIAAVQTEPTERLTQAKVIRVRHSAKPLVCVRALPRRRPISFRLGEYPQLRLRISIAPGHSTYQPAPRVSQRQRAIRAQATANRACRRMGSAFGCPVQLTASASGLLRSNVLT